MRHNCPNRLTPNLSTFSVNTAHELLGMFCVSGLIPFSQFDNKYLRQLFNNLGWNPPCSESLNRIILTELVRKIAFAIAVKIQSYNVSSLSLTMDLWSSKNSKFVGITALWLNDSWDFDDALLGMIPCALNDEFVISNEEIKRIYDVIDKIFKFIDKVSTITIDNGADIISFAQSVNKPFIRCGAHCLQLAIFDALNTEEIFLLLAKVKYIAKSIKKSIKYQTILQQAWPGYARSKNIKVKNFSQIPISCRTRWNSTYEMLESFLAYYDFLEFVFGLQWPKNWFLFSEANLKILNIVRGLLMPLADVNLDMQQKKIPSIPLVVPKLVKILVGFHEKTEYYANNDIYHTFKVTTYKSVLEYLNYLLDSPIILGILFLHPNLQNFTFLQPLINLELELVNYTVEELRNKAEVWIKSEMGKIKPKISNIIEPEFIGNYFEDLDKVFDFSASKKNKSNQPPTINLTELINTELAIYKTITLSVGINLLEFWKNMEKLPILSKVANKWLTTPISSADVERCFSIATKICTSDRSCLSDENIGQLHFLYCNQKIFNSSN